MPFEHLWTTHVVCGSHGSKGANLSQVHLKKEGLIVSDWLWCIAKSVAVRSENLVTSVKASNRSVFNGDGSTQEIFNILAMSKSTTWIVQQYTSTGIHNWDGQAGQFLENKFQYKAEDI